MINFVKRSILSTFSLYQRLDKIDLRIYVNNPGARVCGFMRHIRHLSSSQQPPTNPHVQEAHLLTRLH